MVKNLFIQMIKEFIEKELMPLIIKEKVLRLKEKLDAWLYLLAGAIETYQRYYSFSHLFKAKKIIHGLDEVNYADIIPTETVPESGNSCQS